MKQEKVEFAGAHRVEEADIGKGLERARQEPGADIDHADLYFAGAERIEHLHLVRRLRHVDDLGHVGMEALERTARKLGVERARERVLRRDIVEHRARDRRFADAALVGADDEYRWLHGNDSRMRPGVIEMAGVNATPAPTARL